MASQPQICNLALTMIGSGTITAITDNNDRARALSAVYAPVRDAELRSHLWRFSIKRASLPKLVPVPVSGPYTQLFQLPSDCLKVLEVGDWFPGADVSDYRTGPSGADWKIEGTTILSNLTAPLSLRYVAQITDEGIFDAAFVQAFAARLAQRICNRMTPSTGDRQLGMVEYKEAISLALRANAIEEPPEHSADSSWVLARIQ